MKVDLEINPIPIAQRRKSIRLKGYDYSQAGGYFITIVTFRRECLFGEVVNGETQINSLGKIIKEEWFRSTSIRKEIRLFEDEFVIMPNHIHGIVWIDTPAVGADGVRPDSVRPDETAKANNAGAYHAGAYHAGAYHAPLQRKPKSLGSFIAGFKASVTRRAGQELNSGNIWQRNYYEHIIRNQADYERIAGYIMDNPLNWNQDDENPQHLEKQSPNP